MALSTSAAKLQQWLERYKITATNLYTRIGANKIRGSFGNYLTEVKTTDLHAPGSFAATPQDDRVALTWVDLTSPEESGYSITRSTDASFKLDLNTFTAAHNATSATDTGLTAGTTYYYKIHGTATGADGIFSILNTTTTAALSASASLVASLVFDTTMTLTWAAIASVTGVGGAGYTIESSIHSNFSVIAATHAVSNSTLTQAYTGLTPGTTYYFRVYGTATGKNIKSYTTVTQATAASLSAPTVPIASAVTSTGMTLTWTNNGDRNITGYILEQSASGGAAFTTVSTLYTGALLTYAVAGLTTGTTYYFRVKSTATGYTTQISATCTQATS